MQRATLIGIALCVAAQAPARAADALLAWDEFTLRSFAILQCHQSQSADDKAFLAKADAIREAAAAALQARLDTLAPARRNENGKRAADTLQRRTSAHDRFIQSQVVEYGCDWLDGAYALSTK